MQLIGALLDSYKTEQVTTKLFFITLIGRKRINRKKKQWIYNYHYGGGNSGGAGSGGGGGGGSGGRNGRGGFGGVVIVVSAQCSQDNY